MKESLPLMALLHAKHIGPRTARILLAHYQTAERVFQHKNKHKPNLPGIGPLVWESLKDKSIHQAAEKEWSRMEKNKISFFGFSGRCVSASAQPLSRWPIDALFKPEKPEHQKIMDFLSDGPKMLDLIAFNTGFNVSRVATLLFEMEMMGVVHPLSGKRFGLV